MIFLIFYPLLLVCKHATGAHASLNDENLEEKNKNWKKMKKFTDFLPEKKFRFRSWGRTLCRSGKYTFSALSFSLLKIFILRSSSFWFPSHFNIMSTSSHSADSTYFVSGRSSRIYTMRRMEHQSWQGRNFRSDVLMFVLFLGSNFKIKWCFCNFLNILWGVWDVCILWLSEVCIVFF